MGSEKGKQLKDYGENAGLLQELEQARIVQSFVFPFFPFLCPPSLANPLVYIHRVGRTIKQGFVTFPLCIVLLSEKEMLQTCTYCERVEQVDEVERFKRCGKCKRRYYVSPD